LAISVRTADAWGYKELEALGYSGVEPNLGVRLVRVRVKVRVVLEYSTSNVTTSERCSITRPTAPTDIAVVC